MALGYEGLIKLGAYYVLGTGSSVPRTRIRLESSSGYGGRIKTPEAEIGVGAPFNYDWSQMDGSINFEMTRDIFEKELKPWLFDRQSYREIDLSSRKGNIQRYENCFFNTMSISASEGGVVDGSVGFMAVQQDEYVWGDQYINNRFGADSGDLFLLSGGVGYLKSASSRKYSPIAATGSDGGVSFIVATTGVPEPFGTYESCTTTGEFPPPLNPSVARNLNPIPYWNTSVAITKNLGDTPIKKNFSNWSLDFSQEVVKFFGCNGNYSTPQEPLFISVGPLMVVLSGSYMDDFTGVENGYLGDYLYQAEIDLGGVSIKLRKLEATSEADDVQTGDSPVPLTVEYAAYGISS